MTRAVDPAHTSHRRVVAIAAMLVTLALGLASRHWPGVLPAAVGKYPGDALWALMVLFAWRALRPRARSADVAACALATSGVVEVAKLWQAPWLATFRHTTVGHLLLGHVFSWQNLVAYGVGVLAGVILDRLLRHPPVRRSAA